MRAMFSCLNVKPDDIFLPYNIPKAFNKTGHGLTGIVTAWYEFKPVLHSQIYIKGKTYAKSLVLCAYLL